jgi:hypothetical protein
MAKIKKSEFKKAIIAIEAERSRHSDASRRLAHALGSPSRRKSERRLMEDSNENARLGWRIRRRLAQAVPGMSAQE